MGLLQGGGVRLEHFDENTSIQFNEYSEKEEFLKAKENIDILLRSSPSESICRLNVSCEGRTYKGILQVCSGEKKFQIEEVAISVNDLQKILFQKMHKTLDQWKKGRSIDEITGLISLNSFSIEKEKKVKQ